MTSSSIPRRGEIWIVDLDPTRGAEIQKQRTAVVLSCDGLAKLPIHIIVPITGWQPGFASLPWFPKKIGSLNASEIEDIAYRVALCIGVKPF